MMITEFETLDQSEKELMFATPVYVAILIAGADGEIDNFELKKAVSIANSKNGRARKELMEYYKVVTDSYEDKLKMAISNFPSGNKERELAIKTQLERLNDILPKIPKVFAVKFYASIKDIAKQVAEASGGVFGYMAVGYEESKLLELKMINNPGL